MAGTAVFRIVVSSDSMKNATATNHGRRRLLAAAGWGEATGRSRGRWGLKQFRNYCGLKKVARCGFPWEKTTKRPVASVYTNRENGARGHISFYAFTLLRPHLTRAQTQPVRGRKPPPSPARSGRNSLSGVLRRPTQADGLRYPFVPVPDALPSLPLALFSDCLFANFESLCMARKIPRLAI